MSAPGHPTLSRSPEARVSEQERGVLSPRVSRAAMLALPCTCAAALAAFVVFPAIRLDPSLTRTFLGAAVVLVAWSIALYAGVGRARRTLSLRFVPRRHHYVQACAQTAVLLYWGWHVAGVYDFVPFIVAQLIFAYGFDSLLTWSRRDTYVLGFGAFPIVLSINLFLWFKPEWFYWQFAMIAVGYAAKELIRWTKDGRSAHIFNPSSFPLGVFSLGLILTGATDATWGLEIAATQFNPPQMYLVIFLAALPGQLLFGVASMTLAAVLTTYVVGLVYFGATGTYLFHDAYISLPVFLGMHLLFTDPSTSPRTETGRILFGVLYGLGTTAIYAVLVWAGVPPFYDKLLPVPIMNLLVRRIDRIAAAHPFRVLDPSRLGRALSAPQRNVAYATIWAFIFVAMSGVRAVGDSHPGQWLPFWQEACNVGRTRACEYLTFMKWTYCDRGSSWACNEYGIHEAEVRRDRRAAFVSIRRGCDLGFTPACENVDRLMAGVGDLVRAPLRLADLPIVLRGSKGPVRERDPVALYAMACQRGWRSMCDVEPEP